MTTTHSPQSHKGRCLASLRVSTPRQGERVSLLMQRDAIARFAVQNRLEVIAWLEEKETAVFGQVLRLLRKGKGP